MVSQVGKSSRSPRLALEKRTPIHPRARRGRTVMAALPFQDLRPDGDDAPLGEGIADELLQGLNLSEELQVVSRTTAFRFGGAALSPTAVGRHLHANAILGGSLRKEGDLLSLKVDLIDVKSGRGAWSRNYLFDRKDLFITLDDIIRRVAGGLSQKGWFVHDGDLDSIRSHPRCQELMARIGG